MLSVLGGADPLVFLQKSADLVCMETPEERAARIIEKELGIRIVVNDDKSGTSKYDLHGPPDSPRVAIEHTSARDADLMALWNALSKVSPLRLEGVKGAWVVDLDREGRRARNINRRVEGPGARRHLAEALRMLEQREISDVLDLYTLKRDAPGLAPFFQHHGIDRAHCYPSSTWGGSAFLTPGGTAGMVDEMGAAVPSWIGEFLRHPKRAGDLNKLRGANTAERHVFVDVAQGGTSFAVESYLMEPLDRVPAEAPDLPEPVTGVWLFSTFNNRGIRWDASMWKRFGEDP